MIISIRIQFSNGLGFSGGTGCPVNILIYDSNGKTIQLGIPHYTDPNDQAISNIYLIEYVIVNLPPYWLVVNRIYS